jgi:hypothetical protein
MTAPQSIAQPMQPSASSLRPVDDSERIVPVDVLRGVALLGILLMNIQSFSMIGAAYVNPTAYGDLHGANWWVWLLCHILADQKFMTIFSMLFGAGILLMTQHVEARGLRSTRLHYRRMGWLILFGLLHGFLLWDGDILYDYGVGGLIVYLLRKMAPWASLQGVEKVLKSFIEQRGKTFKKNHDLAELAGVAVSAGLPPPDAGLLGKIQCKADVRYSAASVDKAEALEAHYGALAVCADVAPRLKPQSGWHTRTRMISYLVDGKPRPIGALVVSRLKAV